MGKIYHSITELVGNTPLVEFVNYEKKLGLKAHILGKLEYFNPSGSVKDRAALTMIEKAEEAGEIKPGDTLFDFSSGNMGIATAAFANAKGYRYAVVLQPGVSAERTKILKAYGTIFLTPDDVPGFSELLQKGLNFKDLTKVLKDYAASKGWYALDQGSNPNNPLAHYETTGPELWEATDGQIDYAVMLVGTGGTLAGVSKYLREKKPDVKIIAAQPAPVSRRTKENPNPNVIDGVLPFYQVDAERVPTFFDPWETKYDECLDIVAEDAYATARELVASDGVFLGQSAAAAVNAATVIAKRPEAAGKNIVVMLADNAFKYLSTNTYQ